MSSKNSDLLYSIRHSAEHVLTQAVQRLYPNKFIMAMGPATEDGFYFDFEPVGDFKISDTDFPPSKMRWPKLLKKIYL